MKRAAFAFVAALTMMPGVLLAATLETIETGSAGSNQAIDTRDPYLALTPIIRTNAPFEDLGEIKWFGGNYAPSGYIKAEGQVLPIQGNEALFSKLGTRYGGDGTTSFALPDLRGRAVIGAGNSVQAGTVYDTSQVQLTDATMPAHNHTTADGITTTNTGGGAAFDNRMPSIAMRMQINASGIFPSRNATALPTGTDTTVAPATSASQPTFGFLSIDADPNDQDDDRGVLDADGRSVDIPDNLALFSLLGANFGGDSRTTFALPDTSGRLMVGTGLGPGLSQQILGRTTGSDSITLSEANLPSHVHTEADSAVTDAAGSGAGFNSREDSMAMNFVIALTGVFPGRNGPTDPTGDLGIPLLGEIAMFAGNFAPRGWAFAQGQILQVSQFDALFSILGTQYGGDGRRTFALPDLRGRTPIGTDDRIGLRAGTRGGSETTFLTQANLPAHTHSFERAAAVPLPAGALLLVGGLAAFGTLRKRRAAA